MTYVLACLYRPGRQEISRSSKCEWNLSVSGPSRLARWWWRGNEKRKAHLENDTEFTRRQRW